MSIKNAALLALGFSAVSFALPDGARSQTSRAPPLSLARPAPSPDDDAPPPAIIRASPPESTDDAPPPPKATAKRPAPRSAARDAAKDAPPAKPAADYDGLIGGTHDEPVERLPDNRAASRSKSRMEPDSALGQPPADSPEDAQLKRKLTICRDCN